MHYSISSLYPGLHRSHRSLMGSENLWLGMSFFPNQATNHSGLNKSSLTILLSLSTAQGQQASLNALCIHMAYCLTRDGDWREGLSIADEEGTHLSRRCGPWRYHFSVYFGIPPLACLADHRLGGLCTIINSNSFSWRTNSQWWVVGGSNGGAVWWKSICSSKRSSFRIPLISQVGS